ncbi:VacJ family lipoprotein [Shimia thalassica]|uniref:MlaA family lipoprotein n=1 Tax=Shimia thalassica TaxID=1715693 RepID=UPI0026E21F36|nr:VacJ family lipoprotein [Shimia thalassica]MDO6501427.1 VacJ family lipoprotein [Shimia thalassica]
MAAEWSTGTDTKFTTGFLLLFSRNSSLSNRLFRAGVLAAALFVAACANNAPSTGVYDPYEAENRGTHEFNKDVDTYLVSPLSDGYGVATTHGVRDTIGRFSAHLALPNDVANDLLQAEFGDALHNTGRFAMNTIVGIGGLFDPAADIGLERRDTDFGETMHVWGMAEGPYVEMPFFGPSTSRDTVGFFVDVAMNPFVVIFQDPTQYIGIVAYVLDSMGTRYDYDTTVDSILYESADSYGQARSLYLQNRRFELGMSGEDVYLDPYSDPYSDPYEDF